MFLILNERFRKWERTISGKYKKMLPELLEK